MRATSTSVLPFAILRPVAADAVWRPLVSPTDILQDPDPDAFYDRLERMARASFVVVDFETRGTRSWHPADSAVGVGCAWRDADGSVDAFYLDLQTTDVLLVRELLTALSDSALVGHNVLFDAGWLARVARDVEWGAYPHAYPWRWWHCTFHLYKALAGEDWPGQTWGLKSAQKDLLGWTETNETGIDNWLFAHGFVRGVTRQKDEPLEDFVGRAAAREAEQEARRRLGEKIHNRVRVDKAEMWRVPAPILGEYCILDCIATLLLHDDVIVPALTRFPEFAEFHETAWQNELEMLEEQQRFGIRVNRAVLETRAQKLRASMATAEQELRKSAEFGPRIAAAETAWLAEHDSKEPAQFRKRKTRTEPPYLKKDGTVSKNWLKWHALETAPDVESLNWQNWAAKRESILAGEVEDFCWHPSQRDSLRAWLYGGLVEWREGEDPDPAWGSAGTIWVNSAKAGWVEVDRTDSGALPTDGDLVSLLPPSYGAPLAAYMDAQKELGYVETFLELSEFNGRIHAGWVAPGTSTLRLAGREPNFQQIPKSIELLDAFIPDDDCVWIEADAAALEPHVLAELSRDPALLELYGPGAAPHDLYLYNAADYAVLRDTVRAHYPDGTPGNEVTKERVSAAKAACKTERGLAKTVTLASNYGAGWKKIFRTARIGGAQITEDDAKAIVESHRWKYRASGSEFSATLLDEWTARGGWILSGLGHPVCLAKEYAKDIVNRLIQRTGHDVHVSALYFLRAELDRRGIRARGIVWDFHDQWIFQCPKSQAQAALDACVAATSALNAWLGGLVAVKYGPRVVGSLSEAKMEESYAERQAAQ